MKIETTFAPNHGNLARHVRTLGRRGLRPEVCILRLLQFVGAPLAVWFHDIRYRLCQDIRYTWIG